MTFLELAKKRFSVRHYQDRAVEEEKLKYVLEAGRIAPSAVNFQPWHFIVARDEKLRKEIAATYREEWLLEAPVIIIVCGDHSKAWRRGDGKNHCNLDAAIAIDHMTLAAAEQGLGTCWVCNFNAMQCRQILRLPRQIEAIALLPLGYPVESADLERHTKQRKKMEEIVHWDGFER
ncbi:MAG: nitroreductase [Firmicutes bacterium]|nr:nitroreductase [Bacillota bacterium]